MCFLFSAFHGEKQGFYERIYGEHEGFGMVRISRCPHAPAHQPEDLCCSRANLAGGYFEPGAPAMILSAAVISGSISAGIPITISESSIPENFLDPSHPSEKFGLPVR